ncbi:hemagglutinin repeat-containing protein [Pantoea sp. FN0302]|uniref:two-partner secretion domain-containing protein n=1 Tax=Pantoea sp. FN0302 TaxID=3418558 RepID=UPI003CF02C79
MNKLCYRIIFNKVRGMLMVVPDIARGGYTRFARSRQRRMPEVQVRINPLCYALWFAAGVVSLPTQANIVADSRAPGNQQPTVVSTANGLPQINIQTPNSHGVSRNQYSQLDVDKRGAILNNSHKNVQTKLGGMVAANPWLAKQEASVILNEVNSRNPSQLNGFIEVAGKRAAVVIANPSGITCNGCGFINASRNTLTTGQPVMENGQLKGFDVNGGRINIEGKGLRDTAADYTQIIAQSVTVNAKLHAGELNVVTGRNEVSAEGRVTRVKASDATSQPAYALDVAALGGMYANKITLTGTEQGVGVRNAGELGASVGELRLTLDGKLENSGTLHSHDALHIASQDDQHNSGKIGSQQDVTLTSEGTLHNSGTIIAAGNNRLTAQGIKSSSEGTLAAGVDNSGALTQPGNLVLTSQGELQAQGQNLARDGILVQGARVDLSGSQTTAGNIALTSTQGDITTSAATLTGKNLRVQAATQLTNKKGKIASDSLSVTAKNIDNEGGLLRQQNRETLILNTGSLLNNQGTIVNEGDTHLQAQDIENRSGLIAGNGHALTLDAERLNNQQGSIQLAGNGRLTVNAGQLEGAQGNLLSAGAMTIKGDHLDLSHGQTQAESLTLTGKTLDHHQGLLSQRGTGEMVLALSDAVDNQNGRIESGGSLNVTSGNLNNRRGTLLAADKGDLQLHARRDLNNAQGKLLAGNNLQLSAATLQNQQGLVAATHGEARLTTQEKIDNTQGRIEAARQLTAQSQGLNNRDGILLGGDLAVNTQQGELTNARGKLVAQQNLNFTGGKVDNTAGLIQSGKDLLIDTQGQMLVNAESGKAGILSGGTLSVTSGAIDNRRGLIAASDAAHLTSGNLTNTDGTVLSEQALTLDTGALNNQRGLLQSAEKLTLDTRGETLNNTDSGDRGGIVARGDVRLKTGQIEGSKGVIQGRNVVIDTQQHAFNHQEGVLSSQGGLQLDSGRFNNQAGRIQAEGEMQLNTHGEALINQQSGPEGGIIAGGDVILTSGELNNDAGMLASAGDMQLNSGTLANSDGILAADKALTLVTDRLDNGRGLLQAGGQLSLDTQGAKLINTDSGDTGGIIAGGDLQLSTGQISGDRGAIFGQNVIIDTHQQAFDNQQGKLGAQGILQLNSGTLNNRAGEIASAQELQLDTHGNLLANRNGRLIGGDRLIIHAGEIDNQNGRLTGQRAADIIGGNVNNRAGTLASGTGSLTLTVGEMQNQGGLLQAGSDLTLDTQGHTLINTQSGDQRGIVALNNLDLHSADINNQGGFIAAGNRAILTADKLNNVLGQVAGNGGLTFNGQAVDNTDGKLQSAGDVAIDTAGQRLVNQRGLIAASGDAHIGSGLLDNQQGQIQSGKDLTLNPGANRLLNQGGRLLSADTLTLTAGQLDNQSGQVQSIGTGRLVLAQQLDNSGGFIHGGQGLDIITPWLINRDTGLDGKGIEGAALTLQTNKLDNSQGALRAADQLELTVQQELENVNGLISSAARLIVQDAAQGQTLKINNRQGTLIVDKEGQIRAASLSGDGQVLSKGNLGITLNGDFHNVADVKANGTLQLTAKGDVTNESTIGAQQALFLSARNIDNRATGEISAQDTHVKAANNLNNTGLIDGALTHLVANVLNNTGTGRIYGDHIAMAVSILNNLSENGKAAVIAARERFDIAAGTINNRHHALIYSAGDMQFGRQLDNHYHATGQGEQLNNAGATIEAGRNASIAMAEVNNSNNQLTTTTVTTENARHHEAALKGHADRFDWGKVDTSHKNKYGVHKAIMPDGTSGSEFYEYSYQRVVQETQVKESDPGKILSGGNMFFTADRLANHDSQILAGATLGGQIGELDNQATKGTRVTTDNGTVRRWYAKKKKRKLGGTKTSQGKSTSNYRPAAVTQTIDLNTLSWQANTTAQGTGYQTGNRQQQGVATQAGAVSAVNMPQTAMAVALPTHNEPATSPVINSPRHSSAATLDSIKDRPLVLPAGEQFSLTLPATVADGQSIRPVIRTISPNIHLPDNSLFALQPASDSHYLVETDPRFVNQKTWLGSDYMQNALSADGSQTLKRLGDGYYEQRLVRDQIVQLTGNRYISGYHSDEEQFRGLMNNGVAFGERYQLEPGVALTPAQMALLTSDIVWLVNHKVTLPDGTQQTVLVPQVYAKVKEGDLTGDGALLGGGDVAFDVQRDMTNSGTIHGREVTQLTAQTLANSGYIGGNQVSLTARQDIINTGGTIGGDKRVSLLAGRDITSQATLRGEGADRWMDRPAGIYVQAPDGALTLSALNNITLTASDLGNAGKSGTTRLEAGNDLTLDTLTTRHSESDSWGSDNYRRLTQQTDVGTHITTAGDLQLSAGRDIRTHAADVMVDGALSAAAGRDIALNTGNSVTDLTEHSKQSSSGLLSRSSLETHDALRDRQGISTTFSGESIQLQAGRDIAVTGSNVTGTQDVGLVAGRDLHVTTAAEFREENHQREEKTSGLMGTGGIGFTIGKASQKSTTDATGTFSKGSAVGSSDGSVILSANNQLKVHGSDVIAGKDLTLSGSDVAVSAAENSHTALTKTEQKQSGLTLALSGTVGSALNSMTQMAHALQESGDDRLKALQATKMALTGVQGLQAYQIDGASTDAANAGNSAAGLAPGDKGAEQGATETVGISLSYGSQSSKSETRTESHQAQGSTLGAGGHMKITATGEDAKSRGDIRVQGSQLKAGGDMALTARNDMSLLSAENTERTDGKNSSQGGSLGVGLTAGSGGWGISVSASVNGSRGRENGNGVTHTESVLEAGEALSLKAGRDTTLRGAQVRGDSVKVETGRNLTLASEQDSDRYDSKQRSASAGGSFTFGSMTVSASVNLSRDNMHSHWQSVAEQTGVFAGKGGFDILTGQHTQLDGAVMASTADGSLNKLDTGTLGFSDIHNHADYKTQHQSVGFSTGGSIGSQFAGNLANGMLAGLNSSGRADSVTKAAVGEGRLVIRDQAKQQQDVTALRRDTAGANPGLEKIFSKEKEQRRQQQAQLIGEIGSQAADIARTQGELEGLKAKTDPAALAAAGEALAGKGNLNPAASEIMQQAYNTAMAPYGTGSALQQGMQAATAAIQGLAGGNIGQAVSGAAAPYLAEKIHKLTEGNQEAKAMAHAVVGAVASYASGNSALAGAAGAVSGELMAQVVMKQLYPGKEVDDLTETEKQKISALGTLAAGLAGGLAGDSSGNAVAGAQAGKNAVENNALGSVLAAANKQKPGTVANYESGTQAAIKEACSGGTPISCETAMAAVGSAIAWPLLPGAAATTSLIGAGANAGVGLLINGEVNPNDVILGYWTGAFTAGTGLWGTMGVNAASGATSSYLKGDDPLKGGVMSGAASGLGYGAGKVLQGQLDKVLNPNWKSWEWVDVGMGVSKPMPLDPVPGVVGNMGSSASTEYINDRTGKYLNDKSGDKK